MLEKTVEKALIRECKKQKWLCYKFVAPGRRSVPDRIVITDFGKVFFVELKAPGKIESKNQLREAKKLRAQGCTVYGTIDSLQKIKELIELELLLR